MCVCVGGGGGGGEGGRRTSFRKGSYYFKGAFD